MFRPDFETSQKGDSCNQYQDEGRSGRKQPSPRLSPGCQLFIGSYLPLKSACAIGRRRYTPWDIPYRPGPRTYGQGIVDRLEAVLRRDRLPFGTRWF